MYILCALAPLLLVTATSQPGGRKIDFEWFPAKRVPGQVFAINDKSVLIQLSLDKKEIFTYPFHDRLASGMYNRLAVDAYSYRVKDVLAGDWIVMHIVTENNQDYCAAMSISVRPNGTIPPSHRPKEWHPYHEVNNAYYAEKYDKVPIPRFLRSHARPWEYPCFNTDIPKADRIRRFPYNNPFSYYEYVVFMR